MYQEKQDQIKNLLEYNERKIREISFNNVKIMILQIKDIKGQELASEYIEKHFNQYQDEDEKNLLLTFLNKYKTN